MVNIRTLRDDEFDAAAALTARIFGNDEDREEMFAMMRSALVDCPFMQPEHCWIAEIDGRLVAKWQVLDFSIRIGQTPIRMGGIQAVAAEPDENHKGYPRMIAMHALPEIAAQGFDVLLGYAQRGAFYRRIGAMPVMAEYGFELEARQIPRLHEGEDPFRVFDVERDLAEMMDHYNRGNHDRTGTMIRTVDHWPWMVRRPPLTYICDEGYIGVRWRDEEGALEVRELAGNGPAFYERAVRKLGTLAKDRGYRTICGAVPADHPFVAAAIPYGLRIESRYTRKSGCLAMVLEPLRLLAKLQAEFERRLAASRYFDTQVHMGVRCDGREARFLLNGEGERKQKLDVTLTRAAIAQLVFGYRSAQSILFELASGGDDDPGVPPRPSPEDIELLDVLFPKGHPFMWQPDRY